MISKLKRPSMFYFGWSGSLAEMRISHDVSWQAAATRQLHMRQKRMIIYISQWFQKDWTFPAIQWAKSCHKSHKYSDENPWNIHDCESSESNCGHRMLQNVTNCLHMHKINHRDIISHFLALKKKDFKILFKVIPFCKTFLCQYTYKSKQVIYLVTKNVFFILYYFQKMILFVFILVIKLLECFFCLS